MKQRIYHMTNIYLMNEKCLLNKKRTSETVEHKWPFHSDSH